MRRALSVVAVALPLLVGSLTAQGVERVRARLLNEVVPEADRFGPAEGNPPVKRAYRGEELVGYVFLTSDLPPEERGYSGPIEALVGMTPEGTLTGVRVTEYHESRMSTRGDFMRTPGFQEQYSGKYIGDRFQVWDDVDGLSRVSISVRALSRGVRDSARRVAAAYPRPVALPTAPVEDVTSLSWYEMRQRGVAVRMQVTEGEGPTTGISLISLSSEELADYLMGGLYGYVTPAVERRGGADQLVLYAVDGADSRMAVQQGWSIIQNGETVAVPPDDIVVLGAPWEGLLAGETSMVGAIILDDDLVNVAEPLTFVFDRGGELGSYQVDYTSQEALAVMAAARAAPAAAPGPGPAVESSPDEVGADDGSAAAEARESAMTAEEEVTSTASEAAAEPRLAAAVFPAATDDQLVQLDFTLVREETALERLLAGASWRRVGWTALVLVLATLAFFTKGKALRWISLGATFAVLGFLDGGFLSVSHITSAIYVGPAAVLNDLPLLLMVVFTVVTVLVWGRVFCGFLCPFGALQDFLDRLVPARFKRALPKRAHRIGLKAKYGILALILIPALLGSEASIYQYFEPFGTVFFLSPNLLLWAIAGVVLVAAAVVPRFYCRYACPLGASLAVVSLLSFRRIRRVEQCEHCKVCEQRCPTGAIEGPEVDFKECVRCNDCEIQLIEKTGVCRHDMEKIRPRLVQLKMRSTAGVAGGA